MASADAKAEVLGTVRAEQATWQALVVAVGMERMEAVGITERWSFKDVAAHLTRWGQRSLDRIEASARGAPVPAPPWPEHLTNDDEINDWIYAREHDRPTADVVHDAASSFERLYQALAALSEGALTDPQRFPGLGGRSLAARSYGDLFAHFPEEHEPAIRAWLHDLRAN